jgi:hypothetical protein
MDVKATTLTMTKEVRKAITIIEAGTPEHGCSWGALQRYLLACQTVAGEAIRNLDRYNSEI